MPVVEHHRHDAACSDGFERSLQALYGSPGLGGDAVISAGEIAQIEDYC